MGRVKLEIKRIENSSTRHVTYSKRRNGLLKKAYELSVLCDIDLALIMFSPSGRLSHFSGKNSRIEDVITKFVKLPEHERAKGLKSRRIDNNVSTTRALQMEEGLIQAVRKLNIESGLNNHSGSSNGEIERIQLEIQKTISQLQLAEEMLRVYELDIRQIDSMSQAEQMEQLLEQALKGVQLRKQALQSYQFTSFNQAQMQAIYMWQSSQNGGESSRHVPQDIPWYASRDSQILDHSAAASILSFRNNSQGQVECPPSTSYHPGLLPPGPHDYSSVKTGNTVGDDTSVDFSDDNALCSASIWHSSCQALALAPLTSHTPPNQYSLGQQHCITDNTCGRSENRDAEM